MDMREALNTAVAFEKKVRDTYQNSYQKISSATGRRVFLLMANEENDHVRYLESKLAALDAEPEPSADDLGTTVPSTADMTAAAASLENKLDSTDAQGELALLMQVRDVEMETSAFYKQMVDTLPPSGKAFFQRFVEIENGHLFLVEAEIDNLQHKGAWIAVDHGELRSF